MRKARKYHRPEDLEDKKYYGIGPHKKVQSLTDSLASRGFPREMVTYVPPADVATTLISICRRTCETEVNDNNWQEISLSNPFLKYRLLTECMKHFNHHIPNSYLCKLKTVRDVMDYFSTPIDGTLEYDNLIRDSSKLPPNLNIIPDYIDFNPETDTFFNGLTAFPGRRQIIRTKAGEKLEKIIHWPNM